MELIHFLAELTPQKQVVLQFPYTPVVLAPLGDIQLTNDTSNDTVDIGRLKEHIEEGIHNQAYFLGMGDYIDFMSPSNRSAYRSANIYDSSTNTIDDVARKLADRFLNVVHKTEGKWVGFLEGHHFWQCMDGITTDMYIAQHLKAPVLGHCAAVYMSFVRTKKTRPARMKAVIWCHHGIGGGSRLGSVLTKLELLSAYFAADVFLMGHIPRVSFAKAPWIYWPRPGIQKVKDRAFMNTGGWFRGYQPNSRMAGRPQGTYVERRMLPPTSLGAGFIKFLPKHTEDSEELDIRGMA